MSNRATAEKKTAFLAALKDRGSVYHAAHDAQINRTTAYRWRDADQDFAAAWDDLLETAWDRLEASAYERALDGDTTLTIFLLKNRRRSIYGDKQTLEHTGPAGGPIEQRTELTVEHDPDRAGEILRILDEAGVLVAGAPSGNGSATH